MTLLFLKALHIVGFVAWFAGIFYLVRLFVYHREAWDAKDPLEDLREQYSIMEWRLFYIITQPAMILTWIAGLGMLYIHGWDWYTANIWMHFKLGALIVLTVYHFWMQRQIEILREGSGPLSSFRFRLLNELPTLLLVTIVFLAVFRSTFSLLYGIGAIVILGMLFFLAAKWYRRKRESS